MNSSERGTAETRRADAVDAGLHAFADLGMGTAAVQQVADRIGVSQPYVFRLFGGRRALFLACLEALERRIRAVFREAADTADGADPLEAMGAAFRDLVADGTAGGFWMQACTLARTDEEVAGRCRSILAGVLEEARGLTASGPEELARFLGRGILVIQLQAIGMDLGGGSEAAVAALLDSEEPS